MHIFIISAAMGRRLVRGLMLLVLVGLLSACDSGGIAPTDQSIASTPTLAVPKVTITARDFTFEMPDTIRAGLVDIMLNNAGAEPHQAQFTRLNDGVTADQLLNTLKKGVEAALSLATFEGGPNTVALGKSQEVVLDLPPGQYMALCFVAGTDKIPHVEKGMFKLITVKGPSNIGEVSTPKADVQVTLKDFKFEMPTSLKANPLMVRVTNMGRQSHEMAIVKLLPGKTLQDVHNFLQTSSDTPPFEEAGGMATIAAGGSAWINLQLTAGDYVAVCLIADPTTGTSHADLGMISQFRVQ